MESCLTTDSRHSTEEGAEARVILRKATRLASRSFTQLTVSGLITLSATRVVVMVREHHTVGKSIEIL